MKALGESSDFVGICVFADKDVDEVIDGDGKGVLYGMAPGGVIAIHSTISIDCCARLESLAKSRGIGLLDAPVSGARRGAEAGTLCIMTGGEREVFEKAAPVFESYGRTIELAGPIGSGQVMKTLVNMALFSHLAIARTAASVAEKLGLDVEVAKRVLLNSTSKSFGMEMLYGVLMKDPEFAAHAVTMQVKDIRLFQEICRNRDVERTLLDALAEQSSNETAALTKKF
ncbi:NAD(P)-dependent oxidoreductase [Kineobactrum salinum]|uniref:NAD(P)-dependent oxidoreductase n=1 Tax=Kineobactrum salinum TaxID=2708301 RepID=A0A6C0U463_9GAMM|nr:NAD(P)-dependent oxidoreductase [Kineobactrum salinum]